VPACGLGIIGCVAHAAVLAAGGYGSVGAPLLLALACGLAVGSVTIGFAWRERRYTIAVLIGAALIAGEGYALLLTGERTLEAREARQAPIRAAQTARDRAEARLQMAEQAVAAAATTPRLERALTAKAAANTAAIEKAAERTCAVNCRTLLAQQVDAAAAEVGAARAELAGVHRAAAAELEAARAVLAALPAPLSASPLADRLGLEGWQVDLAAAALASLAANGLGAFLLAFAAHGRHQTHTPTEAKADLPERDVAAEADAFARATFQPAPGGRVGIVDILEAYHSWCRARGLGPLPNQEIGAALSKLFGNVGLYRNGSGAAAEIVGLGWGDAASVRPRRHVRRQTTPQPLHVVSDAPPRVPRLGHMADRMRGRTAR